VTTKPRKTQERAHDPHPNAVRQVAGSRRLSWVEDLARVPPLRGRRAELRREGKTGHFGRDDSLGKGGEPERTQENPRPTRDYGGWGTRGSLIARLRGKTEWLRSFDDPCRIADDKLPDSGGVVEVVVRATWRTASEGGPYKRRSSPRCTA
jgi:hypothetical protein